MAEQTVSILAKLVDQVSGPAKGVGGALRDTEKQAGALSKAVASLRGHLVGLVSAYVGFQTLRRALQEAREAADAAQRLRFALGENLATLQQIDQLVDRLQETTRFEADALREIAAQLINRGVGVDQIEQALRATVELSAAMGTDLQTGAAALAQTLQGDLPRGLSKAVPELQKLSREALQAGAAFDVVLGKFSGSAEALGTTPFGRMDRAYNRIGDSLERIGNVLADLLAELLPQVATALDNITAYLQRPEVQEAIRQVGSAIGGTGSALSSAHAAAQSVATGIFERISASRITDPDERRLFDQISRQRREEFRRDRGASVVDPLQQRESIRQDATAALDAYYAAAKARTQRAADDERKLQLDNLAFLLDARLITENEFFDRKAVIENAALESEIEKLRTREQAIADMLNDMSLLRKTEMTVEEAAEFEKLNSILERRKRLEADLEANRQVQRAEAGIGQLQAERAARAELNRELEAARDLHQSGEIDFFELSRRNAEAQEAYTAAVERSIEALERLKAEATDPETLAAMERLQIELRMRQEESIRQTESVRRSIRENLQEPSERFFSSLIQGQATFRQALSGFLSDIASQLANFAARMVSNQILNALFGPAAGTPGGGGGLLGGLLNGLFGRPFILFNSGGAVPGDGPNRDTVPAMLSPREFVMQRRAHDYYGTGVMQAINSVLVPRHALASFAAIGAAPRGQFLNTGGVVEPQTPMPQIVEAVVPPTEQNFERLMRGGLRSFFSLLAEHRDQANAALGRA